MIILNRFAYTPDGTFGYIKLASDVLYTVEKPWRENKPFYSCVPEGIYSLLWLPTSTSVPHDADRHTWYLQGETVAIGPESNKARSQCCIHMGNVSDDVSGCIAPGMNLAVMGGKLGVRSSHDAMLKLLFECGAKDTELSIKNLV